ncbi:hypothetical protein [Corynebacterium freiburgense]|uniref:hypothetical protein n=1 Tax=Corynebacterium freiburgense TaxID=556548 RepID=UPI000429E788|nr:hypothetical protein [Corynebacterium freiburgense]WJZ02996.1 hypothetical protein CFREI_08590 [Corynebacterium freiburgense]
MELPALTTYRMQTILQQFNVGPVDKDDDGLILRFSNVYFVFSLLEEVHLLRIYGYWLGQATDQDTQTKLMAFVREKNGVGPCPRFHATVSEQDVLEVGFQYWMPANNGFTDAQIANILSKVMASTANAMEELESVAPDLVTWKSMGSNKPAGEEG